MMNNPAFDLITIRKATKELRENLAPMATTQERLQKIKSAIEQLQSATNNLNQWLDENTLLQ